MVDGGIAIDKVLLFWLSVSDSSDSLSLSVALKSEILNYIF